MSINVMKKFEGGISCIIVFFFSFQVKECFWEYFSNGMTAAEAKRIHENRYLLMEDFKSLANAAKNPTINQVQHLHLCWREVNLGSVINPFEKLREKIPLYEAEGNYV